MPPALFDEIVEEQDVLWTAEREMLAAIVERLDIIITVYAKVYGNRKIDPVKVPRPKRRVPGEPASLLDDGAPTEREGTVRFGSYIQMIQA